MTRPPREGSQGHTGKAEIKASWWGLPIHSDRAMACVICQQFCERPATEATCGHDDRRTKRRRNQPFLSKLAQLEAVNETSRPTRHQSNHGPAVAGGGRCCCGPLKAFSLPERGRCPGAGAPGRGSWAILLSRQARVKSNAGWSEKSQIE